MKSWLKKIPIHLAIYFKMAYDWTLKSFQELFHLWHHPTVNQFASIEHQYIMMTSLGDDQTHTKGNIYVLEWSQLPRFCYRPLVLGLSGAIDAKPFMPRLRTQYSKFAQCRREFCLRCRFDMGQPRGAGDKGIVWCLQLSTFCGNYLAADGIGFSVE